MNSWNDIPRELRRFDHWVCWKNENKGDGRPRKVPYQATGYRADITNFEHFTTFDIAVAAAREPSNEFAGIGFCLTKEDPYTFIDFDEAKTKAIQDFQTRWYNLLNSYSELSVSGKGCHVIVKGCVSRGIKRPEIEVYSQNRFMTMTGKIVNDVPIEPRNADLVNLYAELEVERSKYTKEVVSLPALVDDQTIVDRCTKQVNGDLFVRLWNGDSSHTNGDASRSDQAMMNYIVFNTKNVDQIKRIWLASPRSKRIKNGYPKGKCDKYITYTMNRAFDHDVELVDCTDAIKKLKEDTKDVPEGKLPPVQVIKSDLGSQLANATSEKAKDVDPLHLPDCAFSEVIKFCYDASFKPIRQYAIASALAVIANICGRGWICSNSGLNLYLMALGRTGTGKDSLGSSYNSIMQTLYHIDPNLKGFAGPSEFASVQALMKHLANSPSKSHTVIMNEGVKSLMDLNLSRPGDRNATSMKGAFLTLYTAAKKNHVVGEVAYSNRENNIAEINRPALSFLAEGTPSDYYGKLSVDIIDGGFIGRCIPFYYDGPIVKSNYGAEDVLPPQPMIDRLTNIAQNAFTRWHDASFIKVEMTQQVLDLRHEFDEWIRDFRNKLTAEKTPTSQITNSYYNRVLQNTTRVAALLAIYDNPVKPVIQQHHYLWAKNLLLECVGIICKGLTEEATPYLVTADNDIQQEDAILVQAMAFFRSKRLSPEYANLQEVGVIPLKYLKDKLRRRKCFTMTPGKSYGSNRMIEMACKQLALSGEFAEIPMNQTQSKFGFNGQCYKVDIGKLNEHIANRKATL